MNHPTPYPRCIFCGAKANSREHAIPHWISKRLGVKDFLPADTAFVGGRLQRRKQPISFASYRAHTLCRPCNKHFKHLEDDVIDLLVPMARGRVVSLGYDSQALLALWASKTAATVIATTAPELREVMPMDHRRSIRVDGRPSEEIFVGYFPWRGSPIVSAGQGVLMRNMDPATRHEMYGAILTFKQLGFYVLGFIDELRAGTTIDGNRPPMIQFWPNSQGLVHWPPEGPAVTNTNTRDLLAFVPLKRA
ncbi:MAG: hypothetical protein QOH58_3264 [Thermoleophilaceae bacterium]|nr:hypothetical protein [Thermoleophilaceae bacterium]